MELPDAVTLIPLNCPPMRTQPDSRREAASSLRRRMGGRTSPGPRPQPRARPRRAAPPRSLKGAAGVCGAVLGCARSAPHLLCASCIEAPLHPVLHLLCPSCTAPTVCGLQLHAYKQHYIKWCGSCTAVCSILHHIAYAPYSTMLYTALCCAPLCSLLSFWH